MYIEAVNREDGLVMTDEGTIGHITVFFDDEGDVCGPDEAVSCVAQVSNQWVSVDLRQFRAPTLQ